MTTITEDQIADAFLYGHRFDIGMSATDRTILERRVKRGSAVKVTAMWPWLSWGTVRKTCYVNTETIPASMT